MFDLKEEPRCLQIELASEMRLADRVTREAQRFLERLGQESFLEINIVIRELLINAIEHGNLGIPERRIRFAIEEAGAGLLRITVEDEGEGFDYRELDLMIPEDPRQIRSRGYPLIHKFSEDIRFNSAGNRVSVIVRIDKETDFLVQQLEGWQVIRPAGDLTASVANKFRSLLVDLVQKESSSFRFDLQQVSEVDSVSLSIFIVLARTLSDKGVQPRLEIINASKELIDLFRLTRMDGIYRITPA